MDLEQIYSSRNGKIESVVKISMRQAIVALLFVSICVSACEKNSVQTSQVYLKAIVADTHDISCGYPVLDFSEDSFAIREMTKEKWNRIVILGLPSQFNVQNKKLYVEVRPLKPEEEFSCLAIGIGYPHLEILQTKDR